jgi:type 1 glutamine amidotransferase
MRVNISFVSSLVALVAVAGCGSGATEIPRLETTTGSSGATTSSGGAASVSNVTSGSTTQGASAVNTTGATGVGGATTTDGAASAVTSDGSGLGGSTTTSAVDASTTMGGAGPTTTDGGTTSDTTGGVGGSGACTDDPYCARSGSFNMLVYSKVGPGAFRHDSINAGQGMLEDIADEWGFNVTITETNELITTEGLAQFEIVFFMNCTGDIFNSQEEAAFEAWILNNGAWAGVHSATDTESGWAFYKELTGQYYDGHGVQDTPGQINFESDALTHPAVDGIPNPWNRNEEWYNFNSYQQWQSMPGLQVLGRKQADNQPIVWAREYNTFRSFYTALGHASAVFQDPVFIDHITGGIMWAVRRDHLTAPLQ